MDEPVDSTKCGGKSNCHNDQPCITHDLWMGLSEQIRSYLKQITLGQLLERDHVSQVAKRQEKNSEKVIDMQNIQERILA